LPYSNTFKDHLVHPRNGGELDDATVSAEQTIQYGDRLRLSLQYTKEERGGTPSGLRLSANPGFRFSFN
jgi:hypothetical protein